MTLALLLAYSISTELQEQIEYILLFGGVALLNLKRYKINYVVTNIKCIQIS